MLKGLERPLCSEGRPDMSAPAVLSDCVTAGPTVAQGSIAAPHREVSWSASLSGQDQTVQRLRRTSGTRPSALAPLDRTG